MYYCEAFDIISTDEDSGLYTGAKLEGGIGGGGDTPPPKVRIIWIGRENHLDWPGNQRF